MARYALTIFLSAFLLFQVQPYIGKYILPWFGGTPGVWTTCLLFFQLILLAGYFYAHINISRLGPRRGAITHLILLALACACLPIIPGDSLRPTGEEVPAGKILLVLARTIGIPYLLLSATGPLLQAWFSRTNRGMSPYRLYALSNVGSLLGLLSYPFVAEPLLPLHSQAYLWSVTFIAFAGCCGWCAYKVLKGGEPEMIENPEQPVGLPARPGRKPTLLDRLLWLSLAACGSGMLLATSNQMSQDVASVPFLWILPLSLYLISFILCFDSDHWYVRPVWAGLLPVAIAGAFFTLDYGVDMALTYQVALFSICMFFCCMVCHGELVRLKPPASHLTEFYLMISTGGAIGGIMVSLVAPAIFSGYWEYHGGLMIICLLLLAVLLKDPASPLRGRLSWAWLMMAIGVFALAFQLALLNSEKLQGWATAISKQYESTLFDNWGIKHDALAFAKEIMNKLWFYIAALGLALCCWVLMPTRADRRRLAESSAAAPKPVAVFSTLPFLLLGAAFLGVMATGMSLLAQDKLTDVMTSVRNFYGVLQVYHYDQTDPDYDRHTLMHGRIMHGLQLINERQRMHPSSYYSENSGIGVSIRGLRTMAEDGKRPKGLNIGVIGLGTGTMAAWGDHHDTVRFYEINPEVIALSKQKKPYFTYLNESKAKVDVALGDARITMERERKEGKPSQFDVLVVDAFSGDAVPLHLLTRQAFENYFYHLKPDGVLAVHISNRYLDLEPLVKGLAVDAKKKFAVIENDEDGESFIDASTWVLVTDNQQLLDGPVISPRANTPDPKTEKPAILFTDDYSNLFKILN